MKNIKIFLVWLIILNAPVIVMQIPGIRTAFGWLFLLPALFWINIPAIWLGLAHWAGKTHFDIQEFGAMPKTPFSWGLLAAFWVLVAVLCTVATIFIRRLKDKD